MECCFRIMHELLHSGSVTNGTFHRNSGLAPMEMNRWAGLPVFTIWTRRPTPQLSGYCLAYLRFVHLAVLLSPRMKYFCVQMMCKPDRTLQFLERLTGALRKCLKQLSVGAGIELNRHGQQRVISAHFRWLATPLAAAAISYPRYPCRGRQMRKPWFTD